MTGIVRDGRTITRSGEDADALVCVYKEDAAFYYDSESQVVFGFADCPIPLAGKIARSGGMWDMFGGIGFADLNGVANSDVTMKCDDGGSALEIVWFWDTESNQFVYQPEQPQIGEDAVK